MIKLCDTTETPQTRDINTDQFLKSLNAQLIVVNPQLAYESGLAKDPNAEDGKEQTAEDIAKAEAERDKVMQAEMINNVTEAVMKSMEKYLDQSEQRMVLQVEKLGELLKV